MDQEKKTRQQAERSRELAQRIMRELTPAGVQVLGGSGSLEKALEKIGARMTQQAEGGALLVAEDPEWTELPAVQCDQVLLVCVDSAVLAGCAQQLAGLCPGFWVENARQGPADGSVPPQPGGAGPAGNDAGL